MKNVINFRDIVKDLSKHGLHITDKNTLNYYIRNFNYNTFIYEYSGPFLIDNQQKKYDVDASSDQLINLFKFDRDMSNHILRYILVIEKIINTNVTYEIINDYNIRDKCLLKLDHKYIEHNILPNINDILPKTSYGHFILKLIKYLPTNTITRTFSERNARDEVYR
jgi:abortive infection bacteriophage resistance protein